MRAPRLVASLLLFGACTTPYGPKGSVADVVRIKGTMYLHCAAPACQAAQEAVGAEYATVARRIPASLAESDYQLRDGDATVLEAGTTLHGISGHAPEERLVARRQGELRVYRAVPRSQ